MALTDHTSLLLSTALVLALLTLVSGHFNDPSDIRQSRQDISPGMSRLLLKNMRFRDLTGADNPDEVKREDETSYTPALVGQKELLDLQTLLSFLKHPSTKREHNRSLMNNLAEMLSENKERDVGSSLRMPSLRFG